MIGEIILAVTAFVTGMVIPKVLGLHKCKHAVVYHKPLSTLNLTMSYSKASGENYPGQYYKVNNTFVTCKQCTVCKDRVVRVSDGSDRTFNFDAEFVLTHIDMEIKKDAETAEKELESRMNELLKTPEQREAEAKIKATEEAIRLQILAEKKEKDAERKAMEIPEEDSKSDEILTRLRDLNHDVARDHEGNIVYVAHRTDGKDVHIKKKRKMGGMSKLR